MNKYIILLIILIILLWYNLNITIENIDNNILSTKYGHPYRYFKDENNNILPIVSLTAFFRSDNDKKQYYKFIKENIWQTLTL